ncbi:MAG: Ig-like domain-containing protein [Burkholderiaceae bacterium]
MNARQSVSAMGSQNTLMALEPRMLFDGAALACIDIGGDEPPLPDLMQPVGDGSGQGQPPAFVWNGQQPSTWAGDTLRFDDDGYSSEIGAATRVVVADPDGPNPPGDYWLTIHGFHGAVDVDTSSTATIHRWDANHMAVEGSLDEINRALAGLTFTSDVHYNGNTVVRMTVVEPNGSGEAIELVVHVLNDNAAPVAVDDAIDLGSARGAIEGNVILGDANGVGADSDPDGDPIGVIGIAVGEVLEVPVAGVGTVLAGRYGELRMDCFGNFEYVTGAAADALQPGETAVDRFSYLLADPEGGRDVGLLSFDLAGAPIEQPKAPVEPPPPVVVGPPDPGPLLPVPPQPPVDGGDPGPTPLPPDGGTPGVSPAAILPPSAFGLAAPVLMANRADVGGADLLPLDTGVQSDSMLAPFSPTAVLGRIESEREQKAAELRRARIEAVKADDECAPAPKPKAVKRAALADGEIVKPKTKAFSSQLEHEGKRLKAPVKRNQARGIDC